ncbi:alkaline phosphatase family protein [Chitinophaga sp. 30R24]|uniref:alkaline phosphatase family protein n=1 Tax=Chitinophaga sp. 30R24 TaxID=3248838 RepID=UPI003B8F60E5
MGKWILLTILLFTMMVGDLSAQKTKYVVLVSIDGFRPDFYRDVSWGAVNMQQMARKGVSADGVNSIFPSLTFPNHTTIITGVPSAKHGIFHNAPFSGSEESEEWYWYEKDITATTLWDAAKASGLITASVNWPVSVGAPVTYNIPVYKQKGKSQLSATSEVATPQGLLQEVEHYATGQLDTVNFNTNEDLLVIDENVARIAGYLIRTYKPAFTTVRLSSVDHFEHLEGREGDMVRSAVAGADRAIYTITESVKRAGIADSTVIIVTGDHGFVTVHTAYAPNVLLKEAGLLNDIEKDDWKAQFKPAGGACFLYLKDPADKAVLKTVTDIINKRPELTGGKFKLISRKTMDEIGTDPQAALALSAANGYQFVGAMKGSFERPVKRGTHGFFPDFKEIQTGFVAYGPGLGKGIVIPEMSLTNVAAIVASLLELPWNTKMDPRYPQILSK